MHIRTRNKYISVVVVVVFVVVVFVVVVVVVVVVSFNLRNKWRGSTRKK